jgi:adenylate cyclase, class 2
MNSQEIEVKFYLTDPSGLRRQLERSGAALLSDRVHETNLRFDTADASLSQQRKVLRLRQDQKVRITYKGPTETDQQVAVRSEIEFEVSDFDAARALLESLGYSVSIMYEKYRTTFLLDDAHITLDEMPYGNFTEIEAPDADTIQRLAAQFGLDWNARITASYLELFHRVRDWRGLKVSNLNFDEFAGLIIRAEDMEVKPADQT